MEIFSDIKKLDYKIIGLYVSGFLGIIGSGYLIIFQFKPELMEKYDNVKLIFLSAAMTMPIAIVNLLTIYFLNTSRPPNETEMEKRINLIGAAMLMNVFVIYPPLLVCYFCSLHFKYFLLGVAVLVGWQFVCALRALFKQIYPYLKR